MDQADSRPDGRAAPRDALAEALLEEAGWVRSLARRLARDQAAADDAAQAALALALERRPDPGGGLRPWLARALRRLSSQSRRADGRRAGREARASASRKDGDPGDVLLERFELQQELMARVRELPESYRGAVLLRYYEGRSVAEIARATGAAPATVRSRISRALARLRRDFAESRGGDAFHSGGALALLLLAAGPAGGVLSRAGAEVLLMKSTTKLALCGAVALLATAVALRTTADRGALAPPEEEAGRELAIVDVRDVPDGGLSSVDGAAEREGLSAPATTGDTPRPAAAAPDAAYAERTVVRATIVDESGAPLPGAVLRSVHVDGRPRGARSWAEADERGRARVEIEDRFMRAYRTEVFPMTFRASAPMRATVFTVSTPRWHGDTDLGAIELAPGGRIEGRLVDRAGRPVEGGVVHVAAPHLLEDVATLRLGGPDEEARRPRADSDAEGRFVFPGVAAGRHRLFAGHEGRLWTVSEPVTVSVGAVVDVGLVVLDELPVAEQIAGVVLRPDGGLASGAEVAYESRVLGREGTVRANGEGRFRFDPRGAGAVEFVARDPSGAFGTSAPVAAERGTVDVVLRLEERRTIDLTVVDDLGDPIEGASAMPILTDVDVFANGGRTAPGEDWRHTDAEGRALIDVPAVEFEVSLDCRGHVAMRVGPFLPSDAPPDLEVTLEREPAIRGRAVAAGAPVAGAAIRIGQRLEGFVPLEAGFPMRFFLPGSTGVVTDSEGRFECPVDSDWTDVSVLAFRDGLATGETELTLVPGEGADGVRVELTEGGVVLGVVVPPAGHDVQDLFVAASRGDGSPVWTRPAPDGTYRLERLAPGPWRVEGRLREPAREVLSVANDPEDKEFRWNVEVVDGEEVSLDVDMRGRGTVALHGRLEIDGEPAAGWRVSAAPPEDRFVGRGAATAEVDGSGSFVLDAPAGPCRLVLVGRLEGRSRVELVRQLEISGTRHDWAESLETGPVDEPLDAGLDEVRLRRGGAWDEDSDTVELAIGDDGRARGRAPVGTARLEVPRSASFGRFWERVRTVQVNGG